MSSRTISFGQLLAKSGIAALCGGYFSFYVPFVVLQKVASNGLWEGRAAFDQVSLQVPVALISLAMMLAVVSTLGWWRYASKVRVGAVLFPIPRGSTFLSGLATAVIIFTTGLNYTFGAIGPALAAIIMRGAVLAMGPIVDRLNGRPSRKESWMAAGLSCAAVLVATEWRWKSIFSVLAAISFGLYVAAYAARLFLMGRIAKRATEDAADQTDPKTRIAYFVEENLTANVVLVALLVTMGLLGRTHESGFLRSVHVGFTGLPDSGHWPSILALGICGYAIGLFGALSFLDAREHSYTVTANRISSIAAGFIATGLLWHYYSQRAPRWGEWVACAILGVALYCLWLRDRRVRSSTQR